MGRRSDARNRLIAAADSQFRERGFEAVGVAQLCGAAGVNKGSFYHFFPSKRELLLEVIDGAWDETGMLARWEAEPPQRPVDQLRRYLQELFAYHYADRESSGRVRGSLLANLALELSTREPEVAARLSEFFRREIGAFTGLLTRAVDLGEVSIGNPNQTAMAIVGCLHGLVMLAKIRDDLRVLPNSEAELLRLAGVPGRVHNS